MRSKKLVAAVSGTALLGVVSLGGFAAADTAGPGSRSALPAGVVAKTGTSADASAVAAPDAAAQARPDQARQLAELEDRVDRGVPGASPELTARLKHALAAVENTTALERNTAARQARASRAAGTDAAELPGLRALDAVTETPPLPDLDLGKLLDAVKSGDLGKIVGSLTDLLGKLVSSLTGLLSGIVSGGGDAAKPALPDLAEPDVPTVELPKLPDLPPLPKLPELPAIPGVPDVSSLIHMPAVPQYPAMPVMPAMPQFPRVAERG
ncbi:hypothetical protein [Yinghuangia seranimata]|uniref:hypothetical protein n=1 Tax=Yinghuangia seranimata TaxID=408067 RepID=UPI00248C8760|nr:hypothetical protein [Yinghuangia seranimata]MDI2126921.1 hypothetical protein [Yinghuangia seranimata]